MGYEGALRHFNAYLKSVQKLLHVPLKLNFDSIQNGWQFRLPHRCSSGRGAFKTQMYKNILFPHHFVSPLGNLEVVFFCGAQLRHVFLT